MKKYRVLVKITKSYAMEVEATSPEGARKVAELSNFHTGNYLGEDKPVYEVVDYDFETTN
jgi:hypothetical protein